MNRIIAKQLKSYPKLDKQLRIAYYEPTPGNQIHMDTMFWQESGAKDNANPIPILVIVDVATRFTKIYIQKTKNEKVLEHYKDFKKHLKKRFPRTVASSILITDGAKELASPFKDEKNVYQKVSTGINKAVLAEAKIRQLRQILRSVELDLNMKNLSDDKEMRIDMKGLETIRALVEDKINESAYQREPPKVKVPPQDDLKLGTPVLAINLHKFFPHQMKDVLRKKSYENNWYNEPYFVSKIVKFNGIAKYEITAYLDMKPIKYYFYSDMLQPIERGVAVEYIHKYVAYFKDRENDPNFFNSHAYVLIQIIQKL
jgi:hypothetical protein